MCLLEIIRPESKVKFILLRQRLFDLVPPQPHEETGYLFRRDTIISGLEQIS